jgi:hypothetical protein
VPNETDGFFRPGKTLHRPLAFPGGLVAILGTVIGPARRRHEDLFDASERGYLRFPLRIAAQPAGDDNMR